MNKFKMKKNSVNQLDMIMPSNNKGSNQNNNNKKNNNNNKIKKL